ncbi:flagellar hook-length control protein FliK [Rhodovulum bhavnagarense]|uniref:Flagellar hook-length control protein FliK n=1 Tax=Rhodovulum bhavnagarense TaxID=992286 RepID=A0A4R2RCS1_9RHOB|nr:flagellar hook-length control protein FliK [Rhodovulum bhavnagarense]TCP61202.1 flagellar hook-length control protein FliK [Rhodovulum bhavnagarense]
MTSAVSIAPGPVSRPAPPVPVRAVSLTDAPGCFGWEQVVVTVKAASGYVAQAETVASHRQAEAITTPPEEGAVTGLIAPATAGVARPLADLAFGEGGTLSAFDGDGGRRHEGQVCPLASTALHGAPHPVAVVVESGVEPIPPCPVLSAGDGHLAAVPRGVEVMSAGRQGRMSPQPATGEETGRERPAGRNVEGPIQPVARLIAGMTNQVPMGGLIASEATVSAETDPRRARLDASQGAGPEMGQVKLSAQPGVVSSDAMDCADSRVPPVPSRAVAVPPQATGKSLAALSRPLDGGGMPGLDIAAPGAASGDERRVARPAVSGVRPAAPAGSFPPPAGMVIRDPSSPLPEGPRGPVELDPAQIDLPREDLPGGLSATTPAAQGEGTITRPGAAHSGGLSPSQMNALAEAMSRLRMDGRIELTLDPVELGRVQLSLMPGEQTITVVLAADRAETLDLMRRHADTLAGALRDLGYDSVSLDFSGRGAGGDGLPYAPSLPSSGPVPADGLVCDPPGEGVARRGVGGLDLRL